MAQHSPASQSIDHLPTTISVSWWLIVLDRQVFWARLIEKPGGTAEVLDHFGQTLVFDSSDSARAALMDAHYRAFDGLDEDDALAWGLSLAELIPPQSSDQASLLTQMHASFGKKVE